VWRPDRQRSHSIRRSQPHTPQTITTRSPAAAA
jgi:hypothetical protein